MADDLIDPREELHVDRTAVSGKPLGLLPELLLKSRDRLGCHVVQHRAGEGAPEETMGALRHSPVTEDLPAREEVLKRGGAILQAVNLGEMLGSIDVESEFLGMFEENSDVLGVGHDIDLVPANFDREGPLASVRPLRLD